MPHISKKLLILFLIVFSALIFVAAFIFMPLKADIEEIGPATISSAVTSEATLTAASQSDIYSDLDGTILSLPFSPGDKIRDGDIVCVIQSGDSTEFETLLISLFVIREGYLDYASTGMPVLDYSETEKQITDCQYELDELNERISTFSTPLSSSDEVNSDTVSDDDELSQLNERKTYLENYIQSLKDDLEKQKAKDIETMNGTIGALEYLNNQTLDLQSELKSVMQDDSLYIESLYSGTVTDVYLSAGSAIKSGDKILTLKDDSKGLDMI